MTGQEQTEPARWPWPKDNELTRRTKVAIAYRERLHVSNRVLCDALDDTMRAYGQFWIVPRLTVYAPDDEVTADLAAELVSRSESVIRRWASMPHPDDPSRVLLPRHGWDGPRRTYLVADVYEAAAIVAARTTYRRVA